MMGIEAITERYQSVQSNVKAALKNADRDQEDAVLVAVSKTYFADRIEVLLDEGHRVFGENRVQETQNKWPDLKRKYSDIELRLIGPLQSNKAAEAVSLFDVIETVDREKIAKALCSQMSKQNKNLPVYIQVNTGMEPQKAGVIPDKVSTFVQQCLHEFGLNVIGLMCIPPIDENPGPHFALLRKLADENGLTELSMGMSGDYETALAFGATSVRVGSALFGERK